MICIDPTSAKRLLAGLPLPLVARTEAGFSLVEIMVGMVIGMFGLLIMMQVFSLAEEQKRTTTSGGDAQSTGAIALFGLQRDIRQAGYAISDPKMIGCNVTLRSGVTLNSMAPMTINHASIPAGDTNTDTLLVAYGNTNGTPQGDGIVSQASQPAYTVQTSSSFVANDRVVATPSTRASPCALTLDTVASVSGQVVTVSTGITGMANGTLFNLGQAPKIYAYAIRNGNLTQCDYMVNNCSVAANVTSTTIWVQIGGNIVSMRAQYGRDTASGTMDGFVDVFDQATPTTACTFARVSAARLALVVRSAQLEKTTVTTVAPTWEGTSVQTTNSPTNPNATPIVLTGNASWQSFRYRVFQTVVPLRNIAWAGAQTGC
ncbi:MAG: PilW family protein [Burkholderiales bacterium]